MSNLKSPANEVVKEMLADAEENYEYHMKKVEHYGSQIAVLKATIGTLFIEPEKTEES